MTSATHLPFPWESLDATDHAAIATLHEARRWVEGDVQIDDFARELQAILGADLRIRLRRARPWVPDRNVDLGFGVLLARDDDAASPGALLDVEPALAAAVVAHAIRRSAPVVVDSRRASSPAVAGAFAAVLVAAGRRAHAGAAPRVLAAGGAGTIEAAMASLGPDRVEVLFTVLVADDAYSARIVVSRAAAFAAHDVPWTVQRLSALGPMPLSLPVVACATPATAADVAALRPGDIWLPGTWGLDARSVAVSDPRGAALFGPVFLAAPASETGVRARLVEDGRLVLSGEVERLCAVEADMVESDGEDGGSGLLSAVGDVPVVVRVEIGEARMTAREWASLGRGDVVTLGRRVGARVLLRVGGVPIAHGELVSVEGEVGVRISERVATGGPTSP